MLKQANYWLVILASVLISRFVGMVFVPFADTTEPRYAEIARLMVETGDWITPWFEPDVPFWGKPPLSFWLQAISIHTFGLSEFSIRLPAWLATVMTIGLTWRFAKEVCDTESAKWSALVLSSMALSYVSAGTVMTDTFLVFGTTLSLVSFYIVISGGSQAWSWLFFVGLAIGLLSKGPVSIVLTGLPIFLWLALSIKDFKKLLMFPIFFGLLLTLFLVLPWYILAEQKTPGFLNYFIVGEHFGRFLNPGWNGDLYGTAHDEPKGTIWIFWMFATFPWGLVAFAWFSKFLWIKIISNNFKNILPNRLIQFLLISSISPMLFFTLAGNILWTYVLPALPFFAILTGIIVSRSTSQSRALWRWVMVLVVPSVLLALVVSVLLDPKSIESEKEIVKHYSQNAHKDDSPLYYLGEAPFSAMFYARRNLKEVTIKDVVEILSNNKYRRLYLSVQNSYLANTDIEILSESNIVAQSKRYSLLEVNMSDSDWRNINE